MSKINEEMLFRGITGVDAALIEESDSPMEPGRVLRPQFKKLIAVAAAAVFAVTLGITAVATGLIDLSKIVGVGFGNSIAEDAFQRPGAVEVNETKELGDYTVTLVGLVSGKDLSTLWSENGLKDGHTYGLLSIERKDGAFIELEKELGIEYRLCWPLISGYDPVAVNGASFGISAEMRQIEKDQNGVYLLFDTQDLELFADHTVYLACYKQMDPALADPHIDTTDYTFVMNEDGSISFRDTFREPHVMFELPLDKSKADPERAEALLQSLASIPGSSVRMLYHPEEYGRDPDDPLHCPICDK